MTKLHFEDLTQITCSFGMLDDDTQERLKEHCGNLESFDGDEWYDIGFAETGFQLYYTYRAKPQPKRLVTWVHVDEYNDAVCCESLNEADLCLKNYGGYIYRIERDEDGSNPTIELVKTSSVAANGEVKGGKDE